MVKQMLTMKVIFCAALGSYSVLYGSAPMLCVSIMDSTCLRLAVHDTSGTETVSQLAAGLAGKSWQPPDPEFFLFDTVLGVAN